MVYVAILAAAFVMVSITMLAEGGIVVVVIATVTFITFAAGLLIACWALIRPPAMLTLDDAGVRPGGMFRSAGLLVPWDAIAAVRIYRLEAAPLSPGVRMLGLVPRDADDPVWTSRRLMRMNSRMTDLPMSISDTTMSTELEQVVQAMQQFRPHLEVQYGEPRAAGLGRIGRPRRRHR